MYKSLMRIEMLLQQSRPIVEDQKINAVKYSPYFSKVNLFVIMKNERLSFFKNSVRLFKIWKFKSII